MEQRSIKYRHNIMSIHSIEAFGSVTGSVHPDPNTHQLCKDVYFVRALGVNVQYTEDIVKLDNRMIQCMREGKLLYKRVDALPAILTAEDAAFYATCFDKWQDSQRTHMETKCFQQDPDFANTVGRAVADVIEQYRFVKHNMSETIMKNFVVKLALWFDFIMDGFLVNWNERSTIKIVLSNITKEQEYLFCYMLTLVGADVLLLYPKADLLYTQQKLSDLSVQLHVGSYCDLEIPKYIEPSKNIGVQSNHHVSGTGQIQGGKSASSAEETGKIRVVIPARPKRKSSSTPTQESVPSSSQQRPQVQIPRRATSSETGRPSVPVIRSGTRQEKSFEELALLASSVVMITIHGQSGESMGTGSGIMVGRAGYILTNNHVASGGRYYSVKIEDDDQTYNTDEVIKYNSVFDLAVIRISRTLNPIPIYQGSQKLVRGQKVVAIGSPLGLFNSVSNGIISGFRMMGNVEMIQFTAPISHGSSGGAVLNMYGEVIGISTAGIDDGQNLNLAVGYECINMFARGFI